MKVGTRLVLANAIPLLLVALFAAWLWFSLSALSANVNEQLAKREAMALLAQDMQRDVIQVQQFLSDVSATRGQDGLDDGFQLAAQHKDGFFQHLANYAALSAQTGDASFATTEAALQAKFNAYYDQGVTMAQAYVAGGPEAGNRLMGQFDEAAGSLNSELATFVKAALHTLQQQMADIAERSTWLRMLAVGLVAGIGVLMFAISHWVAKGLTLRLQQGLEAAQSIAAGNLLQPVSSTGQDEIATLMQAMEAMRQSLLDMVGRVQTASADVANASAQIAQGDADLSNRTEQQASALEETAASMEQLRSTVLQTATNTRTASGLASHASTVATQGGEVVGQVVHTMRDINDSSRKIADIVGLIDSIAFQTNILALNAAVEAARAGEQGRGFAVVASEVRSLAGRSAHAAKEIKQLIDDSVSKVDAGTALVDRAGDTMSKVVEAINNAAAVIAEIDAATAEQSRGVAEASEAVSLMDQTTQQNAALVEEIAASASHLSDNARELVRITSAFRTGASSGPALLAA